MSNLATREGRHRQRYEGQLRLVAGCIPYRFERKHTENQHCDVEGLISVLMISTPNRDDLIFPKGGWEDDETVYDAACREAYEEAGVRGVIDNKSLGVWDFRSKKREKCNSLDGGCRGYIFALEVTEQLDSWPEQDSYNRKWLKTEDAYKMCRYEWMREALQTLCQSLSFNGTDAEHQILLSSCLKRTSSLQHFEEPAGTSKCLVQT